MKYVKETESEKKKMENGKENDSVAESAKKRRQR
jgi:hypothetical protein